MGFWACKSCEALKSERDFLRSLIRPKPDAKVDALPIVTFEADQVISGADHQTQFLSAEEEQRQAEIASEASRVLSGQY